MATDLRRDKIYIRVYLICMNFVVQIFIPFVVLITLNFLTYRTIKASEENLLNNIRIHYSCRKRLQDAQRQSETFKNGDEIQELNIGETYEKGSEQRRSIIQQNKATSLRKREVILSRISIYIVFVFLFCHSLRIIPNVYEMICTYTKVCQLVFERILNDLKSILIVFCSNLDLFLPS